jgi:hypothetical protein
MFAVVRKADGGRVATQFAYCARSPGPTTSVYDKRSMLIGLCNREMVSAHFGC